MHKHIHTKIHHSTYNRSIYSKRIGKRQHSKCTPVSKTTRKFNYFINISIKFQLNGCVWYTRQRFVYNIGVVASTLENVFNSDVLLPNLLFSIKLSAFAMSSLICFRFWFSTASSPSAYNEAALYLKPEIEVFYSVVYISSKQSKHRKLVA